MSPHALHPARCQPGSSMDQGSPLPLWEGRAPSQDSSGLAELRHQNRVAGAYETSCFFKSCALPNFHPNLVLDFFGFLLSLFSVNLL